MYCRGLGLTVLGRFENHDGFDGVMLGRCEAPYHFELTHCRTHAVNPTPTVEDLVVLYIPDEQEWQATCGNMCAAGFRPVKSFNPYWEAHGRTFVDGDGYRSVLVHASWKHGAAGA
jgi:hypothetical protein